MKNLFCFLLSTGALLSACSSPPLSAQRSHRPSPSKPWTECEDGSTRTGYTTSAVQRPFSCFEVLQTCHQGEWDGPPLFSSCENPPKDCDGSPDGTVISGYLESAPMAGSACQPATKTCLSGTWVGPEVVPTCFASDSLTPSW